MRSRYYMPRMTTARETTEPQPRSDDRGALPTDMQEAFTAFAAECDRRLRGWRDNWRGTEEVDGEGTVLLYRFHSRKIYDQNPERYTTLTIQAATGEQTWSVYNYGRRWPEGMTPREVALAHNAQNPPRSRTR